MRRPAIPPWVLMYLMKASYTWVWPVRIWLTYCSMQEKLTRATPTFTVRAVTPTPSAEEEDPELAPATAAPPIEVAIMTPANITMSPIRVQRRTRRHATTGSPLPWPNIGEKSLAHRHVVPPMMGGPQPSILTV